MSRETIRGAIVPGLTAGLRGVLEGAAEDLQTYVAAISDDLAMVVERQDAEDLGEELLAQLRAVAELQRIRITDAGWATFQAVIRTVVSTAIAALTGGLLRAADHLDQEADQ